MKFDATLIDVIKTDIAHSIVPALMGEPGIGKSSFVEDLARAMDTQAFHLPVNQLADRADLTGARLVPTEDGTSYKQMFFPHATIVEAVAYAEENPREWPILFLDEINRTTSDVTSGILTLVTQRQMGHLRLPDNLRIVVAGNDKGNVTSLDDASLSRFAVYHLEPEAATLLNILGDECNPWVRTVLTKFPQMVFQKPTPATLVTDGNDDEDDDATVGIGELFDTGEEMAQITTPRTIDNLSRYLNATDITTLAGYLATPVTTQDRETNLLTEIVEAKVGQTPFAMQIVATIAEDIASGANGNAAPRVTVPKPNCFDDLQAATSVSGWQQIISGLTEKEISSALLYAMHDTHDNARLIGELSLAATQFDGEQMRTLTTMLSTQTFDRGNITAFVDSDTPAANTVKGVISALL